MFQQLVNRNDDLRRLVEKGYALALDGNGFLVVRDIPYLDSEARLQTGAIVTNFADAGQDRVVQQDHQIYFAGGIPCGLDRRPIPNLGGGPTTLALSSASADVVIQRSFSNKPTVAGKFADFYEKIESYVTIISGPAMELHSADPLTFREAACVESTTPFKVRDTLTSRAEIGDLSAKFAEEVVAVIGLGGTGAYVLDFLVKTPVREVRGFDSDAFYVHNAFRSPGKFDPEEPGQAKCAVYQARYENFRHGLSCSRKFVDASCGEDLDGVTFAFVCVDKGSARAEIFDLLLEKGIPFIDVGLGLDRARGPLNGMLRTTYFSAEAGRQRRAMGLAEMVDAPDNIYRTNIQIGELNALNASLAVIQYKQLRGFYFKEDSDYHLLFGIGDLKIASLNEADLD